jgi:hypothetical protein
MLKLEKRTILLGGSINPRTQKHGTENVTALDIPLQQIPLSEEELGVVLLNDKAPKALFIRKKGRPPEPIFGKVATIIPFDHKVKGVNAKLFLGRKALTVADATLSRCRLEIRQGVIWWHVQLQCVPDLDDNHPIMEALMSRMGEPIDFELDCQGYGAQPELPLEEDEDDPEDPDQADIDDDAPGAPQSGDEDEAPAMSRMGKAIGAAHGRKRRAT